MDRQNLINRLVARKLNTTANTQAFCMPAANQQALCFVAANQKALCFVAADKR